MSGRVELYETPSRVSGGIAVDYTGPRFGWKLSRLLPYPVWLARALPIFFFSFLVAMGAAAQQRLMQQAVCRHGRNAKAAVVYRCCTDLADVAVYGNLLDPIYYLLHTAELP